MKGIKKFAALFVLSAAFLASCTIAQASSGVSASSSTQTSVTTSSEAEPFTSSKEMTGDKTSSSASETEGTSTRGSETTTSSSSATSSEKTTEGSSIAPITGDFSIETSDGAYSQEGNVYTITSAGSYSLSGTLNGQIYVAAGDEDAVELDLNGVSITYDENSPIYVASADEVKIKANKGTSNLINDTREEESVEDDTQGGGAIYAKADLKLVGQGSLTVVGGYNNGIHTTKDLKIKKQTLAVTAPNNAIKGNDSVTITSGTITAVSTKGDAIKSSSTDLSSSEKQRGSIDISGGTLTLYAGGDGIDAAYDATIEEGVDEDNPSVITVPSLTIYTNKYSPYSDSSVLSAYYTTYERGPGGGGPGGGPGGGGPGGGGSSAEKAEGSAKGIKAANAIYVKGGEIDITAYDDGIHANYGTTFDSGATGIGDILVSGGSITISCSDDGIHADRYLRISGGKTTVSESHEGIEGNQIYISGGTTYAYADDDSVNAASGSTTAGLSALVDVSGGYLFACVPASGDTDSIDSNGSYRQTGGTVITCGPNNMNAGALDVDGSVSVSGGTLVAFGYVGNVSSSGVTRSSKSGTYGSKAYTLKFTNDDVTTGKLLSYSYSNCTCYSVLGSLSSIA